MSSSASSGTESSTKPAEPIFATGNFKSLEAPCGSRKASGHGIYNLSAGTIVRIPALAMVGESGRMCGTGVFNQTGGTNTTNGLYVGGGGRDL